MNQSSIILASASPRRAELLTQMGLSYTVHPADIDESQKTGESLTDYVVRMSVQKCKKIHKQFPDSVVLGSDTVVTIDGKVLGKPENKQDFEQMFAQLSGRTHDVVTSVAIAGRQGVESGISRSHVTFAELNQRVIDEYWHTKEPLDKAGGYAIQGRAAVFITNVNGSYSGVMGLPIELTAKLLALNEIDVWNL